MFSLIFLIIPILFSFLHIYYAEKGRKNPLEGQNKAFQAATAFVDVVLALSVGLITFSGMFFYHLILYPIHCNME